MAKSEQPLTIEYLRSVLSYNPDTGVFIWKGKPRSDFKTDRAWNACNARIIGNPAGFSDGKGYLKIEVCGRAYLAHRLGWFYVHGSWPLEIDHINGNRIDNRMVNLREVDRQTNAMNRKIRSDSTSGYPGVYATSDGRWRVRISVGGKMMGVGYFATKPEAIAARKEAQWKHGYGPNHGTV